jgi:hypothetical protein
LTCLSTKNCLIEPLTIDNYEGVCKGEEDPFIISRKAVTSLCTT